jgi:hypothetical protein
VETIHEKLQLTFRLDRERPHALSGLQARWAAKIAWHNFCIWLHEQLGRGWPLQTWWTGNLRGFHTKRSSLTQEAR